MLPNRLLLFLFIIIIPSTVFAQQKEKEKFYSAGQFVHESYLFVQQPFKWKGNDWLKFGSVVALSAAVMPLDEQISTGIKGDQRYYTSAAVEGGRIYGEGYFLGGIMAGFGIYGIAAHDTGAKKIAIELLQAGLYSAAITEVLKIGLGRARPYMNEGAFSYQPFTFSDDGFHSMPSGHVTTAFVLSTVLSRHVHSTALKILAYVPAGFTMFSRMYQSDHWLSDEIIGASIGYFVANWVVDLHEGKESRVSVTGIYPPAISISLDRTSAKK